MLKTFLLSSMICMPFFTSEYCFTRRRTFSDYLMIWILVFCGMVAQGAYGNEAKLNESSSFQLKKESHDFLIFKQASTYSFPPKNFDKSTMNSDFTINENGRSQIRQLGRDDSRFGLQRHLYLSETWTSNLEGCSWIPNHPDQEAIAKMIISSVIACKGNPYTTAYATFAQLATHYAYEGVGTYYDMKACCQAITWHQSCFQAYLDHCINKGY